MMPDLGKYAVTVLSGYALTALLIGGLLALSLWQAARARQALNAQEERMRNDGQD